MQGYRSPPKHEQLALRIMVCESEIAAYQARFPTLTREQVFAVMLRDGPVRKDVERALALLALEGSV